MEKITISEYLKKRRLDLGLTQEQLCEGICSTMTLSRLERGMQTPSLKVIHALLQRLGLPDNRFFALLSENEVAFDALQQEIQSDMIAFGRASQEEKPQVRAQALERLAKLEQLAEEDDLLTQQYILDQKIYLGREDGPYSFQEELDLLLKAIRLTSPRFNLEQMDFGWYSMEETTLINLMGRAYSRSGDKKKAIDIYSQLLSYIERNNQNFPHYAGHFCLVAHNCAICLAEEKRYAESVELAKRGQEICTRYGDYQFLPGFLAIQAECLYFMGKKEKCRALYYQAYSIYDATHDKRSLPIMRQEMKERLGIDPPY